LQDENATATPRPGDYRCSVSAGENSRDCWHGSPDCQAILRRGGHRRYSTVATDPSRGLSLFPRASRLRLPPVFTCDASPIPTSRTPIAGFVLTFGNRPLSAACSTAPGERNLSTLDEGFGHNSSHSPAVPTAFGNREPDGGIRQETSPRVGSQSVYGSTALTGAKHA
jgi:hypothetical protein